MSNTPDTTPRDRVIALVVTLLIAAIVVAVLLWGRLSYSQAQLAAAASIPEVAEEELFLDPELLELGEDEALTIDEPAPVSHGEPEKSDEESERISPANGPAEKTKAPENIVTQKQESPVKVKIPSKTDKEQEKIKSSVASAFSPKNGKSDGSDGSTGSGGTGAGVAGNVKGRNFMGCPAPNVKLQNKTVVVVSVVVDAAGNVTEAKAQSGGTAELRRKCENAARSAKWSPKKGAAPARGTITFTITPK